MGWRFRLRPSVWNSWDRANWPWRSRIQSDEERIAIASPQYALWIPQILGHLSLQSPEERQVVPGAHAHEVLQLPPVYALRQRDGLHRLALRPTEEPGHKRTKLLLRRGPADDLKVVRLHELPEMLGQHVHVTRRDLAHIHHPAPPAPVSP
jgi:hypothetical protein